MFLLSVSHQIINTTDQGRGKRCNFSLPLSLPLPRISLFLSSSISLAPSLYLLLFFPLSLPSLSAPLLPPSLPTLPLSLTHSPHCLSLPTVSLPPSLYLPLSPSLPLTPSLPPSHLPSLSISLSPSLLLSPLPPSLSRSPLSLSISLSLPSHSFSIPPPPSISLSPLSLSISLSLPSLPLTPSLSLPLYLSFSLSPPSLSLCNF
ncbi:unnamed protein product [Acanthosepion pharaonis]|uniref:GAIN-B domain-containing protein n=1 Tax=Acanthosepion pharaonis TaxID=158019 RepID=A0A812ERJ2_ACAPH|nr:unnamed protein product [Sepia pharaonis]